LPKGFFTFLLLGASFYFLESSQQMSCADDSSDPSTSFQTNSDKIKAMIAKFPEPPAEEGEPGTPSLSRLGEPYQMAYVEPAFLRRPR
jgi:hypothetical protein